MIDVALTPSELRAASCAVVIDALRATSTIAQALAGGYQRVLCCRDRERALELRAPGRVLAGELDGLRPPDFDVGNSPADVTTPRGDELILATTNGTRAIVATAAVVEEVLLAGLVNLAAVTAKLPPETLLVCAGAEGRPGIEDTYVAGSIARGLPGPRTDAALIAEAVVTANPSAISAFGAGEAARRLDRVGLATDVGWCAQSSVLDIVPRVVSVEEDVAVVALERSGAPARPPETGAQ